VTLANVATLPSGPLNSRYGPWTVNLDLKATKAINFELMRFEAFVWALNVFDTRNPIAVYHSSGSTTTTNWLSTAEGQTYLQTASDFDLDGAALYHLAENNPNFYSNPRLVRFGLRTNF